MPRYSKFLGYYEDHPKEVLEALNSMTVKDFCSNYHISSRTYSIYFKGMKLERISSGVQYTEEQLKKRKERYETSKKNTLEHFINRRKSIADKFGVSENCIQAFVDEGYTLTEIEKGKWRFGEIEVDTLIKYEP